MSALLDVDGDETGSNAQETEEDWAAVASGSMMVG